MDGATPVQSTGVYSSKTVRTKLHGDHETDFVYKVVMMDVRSHKDPRGTANGDMLREEQWAWLTRELDDTEPDLVLLGSPIQALVEDTLLEERWGDFPKARERLLALVTAASVHTNVILLSGDVHRAEVSRGTCTLTQVPPTTPASTACTSSAPGSGAGAGESESCASAFDSVSANLWELTSSGLSHTIVQTTNDTAASSSSGGAVADNAEEGAEVSLAVPVQDRSVLLDVANSIYQV